MKIYLIEQENNQELYKFLSNKYRMLKFKDISKASVIIVNKVYDVKQALDIIDYGLSMGKEILCIKNNFAKEHYVCNYLIKEGARYV